MNKNQEGNIHNNVLFGKDGYLFLHQGGQRQFDFLLGVREPSPESIQNFRQNIQSRSKLFQVKNISYKHVVFPSKPIIKSNYLPDLYKDVKSIYEKYYYDVGASLENVIYPRDVLLELEEHSVLTFKKYDTHNTDKAKEAMAKLLLKSINIDNENVYSYTDVAIRGDLNVMLGSAERSTEKVAQLCPGNYKVIGNKQFITGNTNEIVISTCVNNSKKKRLLIFGDSFFKSLIPFLQPFFSDLMYVRSQNVHMDIVENYSPDVVFTGNAERYLAAVKSDDFADNVVLALYGDTKYQPNIDYLESFKSQLSYKYYKHIYARFKNKLSSVYEKTNMLEVGGWNKHLTLIEDSDHLSFNSLGGDPNIYFKEIYFDDSKAYEFNVDFFSNVESCLKLYYTTIFDSKFSENKSYKEKVVVGRNNIRIIFKGSFLGRKLRLDPLNSIGRIDIYNMTLSLKNEDKLICQNADSIS